MKSVTRLRSVLASFRRAEAGTPLALACSFVSVHPRIGFLLCVLDDDAKAFEFRPTLDPTHVMNSVMEAIASRRRVRCYSVRGDEGASAREERFLLGRGYARMSVDLPGLARRPALA